MFLIQKPRNVIDLIKTDHSKAGRADRGPCAAQGGGRPPGASSTAASPPPAGAALGHMGAHDSALPLLRTPDPA
jgi:hypothetical protein